MVDRIDKLGRTEYLRIESSAESERERREGEEQEKEGDKDAFAALHEKTDWKLLLDKSRLWKKNIQIHADEIDQILFKKINLKTDPSLLRVDVLLKGGEVISPAFLSVSRLIGLKIKNLNSGDPIPEEFILKNDILQITIPANPEMFASELKKEIRKENEKPEITEKDKLKNKDLKISPSKPEISFLSVRDPVTQQFRFEIILVYGVFLLLLVLIIGGLLIL